MPQLRLLSATLGDTPPDFRGHGPQCGKLSRMRPHRDNEQSSGVAAYYSSEESMAQASSVRGWLGLARLRQELQLLTGGAHLAIADVGGGTGTIAHWLAARGHQVSLLELSSKQLQRAQDDESADFPLAEYRLGDARRLPWDAASFDVVLLLGPLYHLDSTAHRVEALTEAARVVRSGGHVVAETLGRITPMASVAWGNEFAPSRTVASKILNNGHQIPTAEDPWFTSAYYHAVGEPASEFSSAGIPVVDTLALEGPWWFAPSAVRNPLEDRESSLELLNIAHEASRAPEAVSNSPHVLTIGRVA